MLRAAFLVLGLLFFAQGAPSQKPEPEPQLMQSLLSEVRQLRQDLQTSAIAARRAQIVIYRLHEEETAVERAQERLDQAKTALAQMQAQRNYETAQIARCEEMRTHVENENERSQYDNAISEMRARLDASALEEQELQIKQTELEADLRIEQAKLERLQYLLDQLDRDLENFALQASSGLK